MSKKNFSEGLDDLFKDNDLATETTLAGEQLGQARSSSRRSHSKNFVSDLDALLQEAMDDSIERYENRQQDTHAGKTKSVAAAQMQPQRAPLTGLDALIRQTITVRETTPDEFGKKRLTVTVDKPKLEKLKAIARLENAFLKDILSEVIDNYIQTYSTRRGIDL